MISWWQHLPQYMDPIAFMIGSFPVRFYSLFWIFGFFGVWLFLTVILKAERRDAVFREEIFDGLLWMFFGALAGGRFGYAVLYAPRYFLDHPLALIIPFDGNGFSGFSGMSFFGGIIGAVLALAIFLRKKPDSLLSRMDYYALVAPIAIFFGRIGNFFNGELFGRVTAVPWGMYFPGGGNILRHPSQLYEAFLEGVILLIFLLLLRRYPRTTGSLAGFFLFGYGLSRMIGEFFREPDPGDTLFMSLSLGQWYSFSLIMVSFLFLASIKRKKSAIL